MFKLIDKDTNITAKSLLLPAISIADIPTLTLDYFIVHNGFKRIGYLHSEYLQPSVGYLPKDIQNGALGLPAELYLLGDVLILQFRTKVRFARKKDFVKELLALLKQYSIEDIFLIGSLPVEDRPDYQILSKEKNIYFQKKNKLQSWKDMQSEDIRPMSELKDEDTELKQVIKNAGIAYRLYTLCDRLAMFFIFCDNIEPPNVGVNYAKRLSKILGFRQLALK